MAACLQGDIDGSSRECVYQNYVMYIVSTGHQNEVLTMWKVNINPGLSPHSFHSRDARGFRYHPPDERRMVSRLELRLVG